MRISLVVMPTVKERIYLVSSLWKILISFYWVWLYNFIWNLLYIRCQSWSWYQPARRSSVHKIALIHPSPGPPLIPSILLPYHCFPCPSPIYHIYQPITNFLLLGDCLASAISFPGCQSSHAITDLAMVVWVKEMVKDCPSPQKV